MRPLANKATGPQCLIPSQTLMEPAWAWLTWLPNWLDLLHSSCFVLLLMQILLQKSVVDGSEPNTSTAWCVSYGREKYQTLGGREGGSGVVSSPGFVYFPSNWFYLIEQRRNKDAWGPQFVLCIYICYMHLHLYFICIFKSPKYCILKSKSC